MVVSYGSSPPAEVIFADPPREDSPTGVIEDTCFRQVEFAGVLRGTDSPGAARQLVDFLVGEEFQSELATEPVRVPDQPSRRPAPGVHRLRRRARDVALARPGGDRRQSLDVDRRVDGAGARVNRLPRWLVAALAIVPVVGTRGLLRLAVHDAGRRSARRDGRSPTRSGDPRPGRSCGSRSGRRSCRRP